MGKTVDTHLNRLAMFTKRALAILDSAKGFQLDSNLVDLFKNKVVSEI